MNAEKLPSPIQDESSRTTLAKQLLKSWKDPEYRVAFVRERVRSSVALQIRALREQRHKMTQKQLGDAIGKAQTWISVLEDPEYGKMSVATLLSLAEAFDTDLEIKFRPFSRALHELTNQSSEYFEVRSFAEELPALENAQEISWIKPDGRWGDILRAAQLLTQNVSPAVSFPDTNVTGTIRQIEMQAPTGAGIPTTTPSLHAEDDAEPPPIVKRSRRKKKPLSRKEKLCLSRKQPKSEKHLRSYEEAKISSPYTQTTFIFSPMSGT
jgi:transcriptional regulator with XRE-family HTH domain